jgi:hypothetical protein
MVAAGPAALASAIPSDIENATAAPNIASCLVMVCIFLIRPEGAGHQPIATRQRLVLEAISPRE